MQTNNITLMKMFYGILIPFSFLVTNPLIYSFIMKVFLFENLNRTLSFDSWNENNEWSLSTFVIKDLCRFYVAATKKGVFEQFAATIINDKISFCKKERTQKRQADY